MLVMISVIYKYTNTEHYFTYECMDAQLYRSIVLTALCKLIGSVLIIVQSWIKLGPRTCVRIKT